MPDLLVKLYDLPKATPDIQTLTAQGITIRTVMAYERHQLIEWVKDNFSQGWASECEVAFSHQPISCHIATEAGKIIGFACFECTCKNFFGPMGVLENKRGVGVGKALLLSSLHAMAASGYAYAIIGDASSNEFYTKTLNAMAIDNSSPGIYRDRLSDKND